MADTGREKHIEACGETGVIMRQPRKPYIHLVPCRASVQELRTPGLWREVICEVLVTSFLLFYIQGLCFNFNTPESPTNPLVMGGLGAGLTVFALIECFGHINLAAMNPAACILFMLTGKISVIKTLLFISAECLGAILGSALIYSCGPAVGKANFRPFALHPDLLPWQGVVVECVVTCLLVLVIAGATDDRNRKVYMPGLPIGFAVGAGILVSGNFTGGALNPMITFGPAVVSGIWTNQWVYWVGPLSGAVLGSLFYHIFTYDGGVFRKQEPEQDIVLTRHKEAEYVACASGPSQNNNESQSREHC